MTLRLIETKVFLFFLFLLFNFVYTLVVSLTEADTVIADSYSLYLPRYLHNPSWNATELKYVYFFDTFLAHLM